MSNIIEIKITVDEFCLKQNCKTFADKLLYCVPKTIISNISAKILLITTIYKFTKNIIYYKWVTCGAPHGSILGLLLFLQYTNNYSIVRTDNVACTKVLRKVVEFK